MRTKRLGGVLVFLLAACGAVGEHPEDEMGELEAVETSDDALFGIGEKTWKGCNDTEKTDARAARNYIVNNWGAYVKFVKNDVGVDVGNCLKNRFQDNGNIHCEKGNYDSCCEPSSMGCAARLTHTAHICPLFRGEIKGETTQNRRANWAPILAHEWAHSCYRWGHKTVDRINDATFRFYRKRVSGATTNHCKTCVTGYAGG